MLKANTFRKHERLCSDLVISRLFSEGNRTIGCFPLRVVFLAEAQSPFIEPRILISAPKRNFKHAVDRNRIKRQIRELYRISKGSLVSMSREKGLNLSVAFIFTGNVLWSTEDLRPKFLSVMNRLIADLEKR